MTDAVLLCKNVWKSYDEGPEKLDILNGIDFTIKPSQHIAIVGASGSGKSTLLNILGGLDTPNKGEVHVNGQVFSSLSDNRRGKIRNQHMGFVYQFHHLLPEFSALENVAMPCLIGGDNKKTAHQKAAALLDKVGLSHRLEHKPAQLSGGERQRVAIARALVNSPSCVLMDEPTGNLDGDNAKAIAALMRDLSQALNTSFVVVTHDMALAQTMDSVYVLNAGNLVAQSHSLCAKESERTRV